MSVVDAHRSVTVPRPQRRGLLGYLLLHRHRVLTFAAIEDAFWDGAGPSTARKQIHVAIHAIRRRARRRHRRVRRAGRAYLEDARLVAVEDLIELELGQGRHRAAVDEFTQLAHSHPLRERLWELLMRAYYRCGRLADASELFHRVRRRLADMPGLDGLSAVSG